VTAPAPQGALRARAGVAAVSACPSCRRLRRVLYLALGTIMTSNEGDYPDNVRVLRLARKHLKASPALYASFKKLMERAGC